MGLETIPDVITHEQFAAMQARLAPKTRMPPPDDATDDEIGLHGEIMRWLKDNGVPYIHARPDKKSRTNPGSPDFAFPYNAKVFFIECKTRTGKRSTGQIAWMLMSERQGSPVHLCQSFSEFLIIVNA